ncbi:hypothetical protein [Streptomyces sp. Ac-502]|uniref:hypothetical protein n=1 Tax=Streptomyces sp. Ac-502 TaxID=3342801 RepID=UPI0038623068
MPETKQHPSDRAQLVIAVVVAAAVMTGAYLVADRLPFPVAAVVLLVAAVGLTVFAFRLTGGRR